MSDISTVLSRDFTLLGTTDLDRLRRLWARELGFIPKNSQILTEYRRESRLRQLALDRDITGKLQTRQVRSLSGVAPFAVMTKPFHCPGECTYCPLELGMPKSYLSDEPAAQRAKRVNFDPTAQIRMRLAQLELTGHVRDKIEIIVIGGTFSAYPESYRREFVKDIFDACNRVKSATLDEAQLKNETARHRIVGLSVETRPDWITPAEVRLFRELGVTKVQVGVQAFDETILERINRGHSLGAVAEATRLLKDAGLKVCYHFMPNLPGSNPKLDIAMARKMYRDRRFRPDFVKIYPCMVIPGTVLHQQWQRGEYQPYADAYLKGVLKEIAALTPPWVRIDRLVRDISKQWVSAGTLKTNMRQEVEAELMAEGRPCQCIRCREIKTGALRQPRLKRITYHTLGGEEVFLSFERDKKLYSLLRLRLPEGEPLFAELHGAAIIREVHTFGTTLPLAGHNQTVTQHRGLGRRLMVEAEGLARQAGYRKLAVIAAVGTREYYRRAGFVRDGLYMTKII